MPYDYSRLDGRIVQMFGTQRNFAKAIGLSERSLSLKRSGIRPWTQPQIEKACNILNIADNEIHSYFFTIKVQ